MTKALLLTGLLLVFAVPAMANGMNIAWGTECWGTGGNQNDLVTFACDSNTSPADWRITPSFVLSAAADIGAIDTYVEIVFETGTIPDWWKRSVVADCNYGTGTNWAHSGTYVGTGCFDIFQGAGVGGGGYGYLVPGVQIQMEGIFAVDVGGEIGYVTVPAGTETFAETITLKNANTVGAGACAGCATGGVLGMHHIIVSTPTGDFAVNDMSTPSRCLVWQHGWSNRNGTQPCNAPVPTRNTTWGQLKSFYR